jgi:acyl dehydratase
VQFRSPVSPGETITAHARVRAVDAVTRTASLDAWVSVDRGDDDEHAIRRGEVDLVALDADPGG